MFVSSLLWTCQKSSWQVRSELAGTRWDDCIPFVCFLCWLEPLWVGAGVGVRGAGGGGGGGGGGLPLAPCRMRARPRGVPGDSAAATTGMMHAAELLSGRGGRQAENRPSFIPADPGVPAGIRPTWHPRSMCVFPPCTSHGLFLVPTHRRTPTQVLLCAGAGGKRAD